MHAALTSLFSKASLMCVGGVCWLFSGPTRTSYVLPVTSSPAVLICVVEDLNVKVESVQVQTLSY